ARAVFRVLAENAERTEQFQTFGRMSCAKRLDARRVQRHPRRVCSPTSVFGLKTSGYSPSWLSDGAAAQTPRSEAAAAFSTTSSVPTPFTLKFVRRVSALVVGLVLPGKNTLE